ncbi:MAG: class I SAM-dependent methyltransferase [Planctomycetales bacterium]|nr:class I SAM-dependent methyltransferase [Planctomycetales bacterium]
MKTTKASIYDFPTYYDLVFGSDTAAELKFLNECFATYVTGKTKRLFEPACGTGRLLYRLGKQGYEVGGIDLNSKAVSFCNRRLEKYGLKGRAMVGDMSDFVAGRRYCAAFNTINSFRHLPTEEAAMGHLQCVANLLRPGGIYVLGLHLTPTRGEASDEESWSARRGNLAINTHMWPIEKNPRRRQERFGIQFCVYRPTGTLKINDVLELRSYTAKQFSSLLAAVPQLKPVEFFDFHYDLKNPIKVDATTEDIVVVLRRS